ncbi:MAG TPA: arginine decarboxylase [Pedobacter sp.]
MENYSTFINRNAAQEKNEFDIIDNELYFHDINLMNVIETYGTPLRFTYLPVISNKITEMKQLFLNEMCSLRYRGKHIYCYCTKSSHFSHILNEVLKNDTGLEISSGFDIPLILSLNASGHLHKNTLIICNGFKTEAYKQGIAELINAGFRKVIPVLDNKEEFHFYAGNIHHPVDIGIRIASEDRPLSGFYTSRLGIRREDIIEFYKNRIAAVPRIRLTTIHFFIDSGISDTNFYWEELEKNVILYCRLKAVNPDLTTLDIGGGMPFTDSLEFNFDYQKFVNGIIGKIKEICAGYGVQEPDIITEFGKYTVAESSGILYKVLGRKQQNNKEKWLMLDGSFITNLPDTWAIGQKYILLPVNNLDIPHEQVYLGGMTCDGDDYYNSGPGGSRLFMPGTRKTQYIGFFHTGAYQEVLSGFGGISHCLLPSPKHIIIGRDPHGLLQYSVFAEEQNSRQALQILGYL